MEQADEQVLRAHVARGRRNFRLTCVVMALLVGAPWLAALAGVLSTLRAQQFSVLAAVAAVVGIGVLALLERQSRRFLAVLHERPEEVVWAYASTGNAGGVHVGLASGKMLLLRGNVHQVRRLLDAVSRAAPWATIGFDPEHHRVFRQSPESLRRSP